MLPFPISIQNPFDIMIGVEEEKQLDNNIDSIISIGYTYVQKYEICMPEDISSSLKI